MRKIPFLACVTLAVLAAAACKDAPTGPTANSPNSPGLTTTASTDKPGMIDIEALVGTWRATKAEAWRAPAHDVRCDRRDLVAEGGTIILVLEQGGAYSVSVTMPGDKTGVSTGRWHYHEFWGKPQIDFYLSSMKNPEWGEIPSFYVALGGDTLTLRDGAPHFLPFDYGWDDPPGALPRGVLALVVFTRT